MRGGPATFLSHPIPSLRAGPERGHCRARERFRSSWASGKDDLMSSPLVTDLYELTMGAAYLAEGLDQRPATFSLFCRSLPASRGYLVAAGLDDALAWLEDYAFTAADLSA